MKRLLQRTCYLLGLTFLLSSNKSDLPADTPACIRDLIAQLQEKPMSNPAASVFQYNYGERTVYYMPPPGCCDKFSVLMDGFCQVICAPDGGFTGGGDGKCADFSRVATDRKLVWRDDRK